MTADQERPLPVCESHCVIALAVSGQLLVAVSGQIPMAVNSRYDFDGGTLSGPVPRLLGLTSSAVRTETIRIGTRPSVSRRRP